MSQPHPQCVDWDHPELREKPRRNRPGQRETHVRVTCLNPDCGYERWLTLSDARHAEATGACKIDSTKRAYRAAIAKHGKAHIDAKRRQHQLLSPSKPERLCYHWLLNLGAEDITQPDRPTVIHLEDNYPQLPPRPRYILERQPIIYVGTYTFLVDFLLGDNLILEIDGFWHRNDAHKAARDVALDNLWPGTTLHLSADNLLPKNRRTSTYHQDLLATLWNCLYNPEQSEGILHDHTNSHSTVLLP